MREMEIQDDEQNENKVRAGAKVLVGSCSHLVLVLVKMYEWHFWNSLFLKGYLWQNSKCHIPMIFTYYTKFEL